MILTKEVKIKNKTIKIEDLSIGSNVEVLVKCDYCGNEKNIKYKEYNKNISKNGNFSCSYKCGVLKRKETNKKSMVLNMFFNLI